MGLAQRGGPQVGVARIGAAAREADLTPMGAQGLGPAGEDHDGLAAVLVERRQHGRRPHRGALERRPPGWARPGDGPGDGLERQVDADRSSEPVHGAGPPSRHDSGRGMRCAPPRRVPTDAAGAWGVEVTLPRPRRTPTGRPPAGCSSSVHAGRLQVGQHPTGALLALFELVPVGEELGGVRGREFHALMRTGDAAHLGSDGRSSGARRRDGRAGRGRRPAAPEPGDDRRPPTGRRGPPTPVRAASASAARGRAGGLTGSAMVGGLGPTIGVVGVGEDLVGVPVHGDAPFPRVGEPVSGGWMFFLQDAPGRTNRPVT